MENRREFISSCSMLGVVALSPITALSSEKDYKLTIHRCKRNSKEQINVKGKSTMNLCWVETLSDNPYGVGSRRFQTLERDTKHLPFFGKVEVASNPKISLFEANKKGGDIEAIREELVNDGKKKNQELIQCLIKDVSSNGYKDIHLYIFLEDIALPVDNLLDFELGVVVYSEICLIGLKA